MPTRLALIVATVTPTVNVIGPEYITRIRINEVYKAHTVRKKSRGAKMAPKRIKWDVSTFQTGLLRRNKQLKFLKWYSDISLHNVSVWNVKCLECWNMLTQKNYTKHPPPGKSLGGQNFCTVLYFTYCSRGSAIGVNPITIWIRSGM